MKAKKVLSVLLVVKLTVMLAPATRLNHRRLRRAEGGATGSQEGQPGGEKPADQRPLPDEDQVITFWNIATEDPDKAIMNYAVDQFNRTAAPVIRRK